MILVTTINVLNLISEYNKSDANLPASHAWSAGEVTLLEALQQIRADLDKDQKLSIKPTRLLVNPEFLERWTEEEIQQMYEDAIRSLSE